jgi:hypothetical protein
VLNKLLALSHKAIPAALAAKGLGKIDPRLEKFFGAAVASGYTIDAALDFAREKFSPSEAGEQDTQRLEQGEAQGTLRPDEGASLQVQRQGQQIPNALQGAASIGAGLAGGGIASLAGGGANAIGQAMASQGDNVPDQISNLPEDMGQQQTQDIPGMNAPPVEPVNTQMSFMAQFPQLLQAAQKHLESGLSPEEAYQKLGSSPSYSGLIKRFEQAEGRSFLEAINEMIGAEQQQMRQPGIGQQGQPSAGKQEFLQGLSQMSQMLENLKSR